MSRINDALKQARQSQQNQPPAGLPPLTPAAAKTPEGVGWILPATVILLLVAACLFIGLAFFKRTPAKTNTPEIVSTPPKPIEPAPVPAVIIQATIVPATNVVVVMAPPQLKLQGIIADPKHPWAIVSGKTVFVGDQVDDFRVAAISQKTITLKKADGSVKTLTLPE